MEYQRYWTHEAVPAEGGAAGMRAAARDSTAQVED